MLSFGYMIYIAVLIASFIVDIIPFIGPPAWIVMVFFQVKYHLNIWIVLTAGVIGSTLGRYVLTLYIPYLSAKILSKEKDEDLTLLGKKLSGKKWKVLLFVFIYTLIPIPTTPLFTAMGMAKIKPIYIMPVFLVGKFLSDMYMVFAGMFATDNIKQILKGLISWQTITGSILGLIFLALMLFTNWKTLLLKRKLVFNFHVWK